MSSSPLYTLDDIKARLPHREPILLLDEVLEYTPEKALVATRHFAESDPLFIGHFPGKPLLPGVLMCEAIAQTGALLVALDKNLTAENATYLFMGLEGVRFSRPVRPGDTMVTKIEKKAEKLNVFKFHGVAYVGEDKCATADFTAKLILNNQMSLGF